MGVHRKVMAEENENESQYAKDLAKALASFNTKKGGRLEQTSSGSTSGSGSGDFHHYRRIRRKERHRLAMMEKNKIREAKDRAWQERREQLKVADEERTAKKSAKRKKRKNKRRSSKKVNRMMNLPTPKK